MADYDQALTHFQQGLSLARQLAYRYIESFALLKIGKVYLWQQQFNAAISHLHQALTVAEEIEARSEQFKCHHALSEAYKSQKEFEKALHHFERFQRIKEALFNQESASKLRNLQILHQTEAAKREAEIYHLEKVELKRQIAKREKTEKKLRQREKELRRAHTIAHLGSFHYTMNSDEVVLSKELCGIVGLGNKTRSISVTEVINLIHPDDFEVLSDFVVHIINGGTRSAPTFRFFHAAGATHYAQLQMEVVRSPDDNLIELFGAAQDITQNIWTEKSLRESESKFRNFIEQALDGIVLVSEKGRIVEWNRSAERITDLTKESVLGKLLWKVQQMLLPNRRLDPATVKLRQQGIETALKTGRAPWLDRVIEVKYRRADGAERIVQQRMFAIKTDKGFQLGSILTDITESKAAEQEISRQNKFLHSVIEAVSITAFNLSSAPHFFVLFIVIGNPLSLECLFIQYLKVDCGIPASRHKNATDLSGLARTF
jgi:PAS domain S-box-containing protein